MKSILVVGDDPRSFEVVLTTAWLIAERFESYVEGVAIRAPATFEGLEAEEAARAVRLEVARAERLKDTFQEFARGRQISGDPGAGERGSVITNWPLDDPVLVQTLGERGRVFDLIVVGRSGEALKVPDTPVMESALFDSVEIGQAVIERRQFFCFDRVYFDREVDFLVGQFLDLIFLREFDLE